MVIGRIRIDCQDSRCVERKLPEPRGCSTRGEQGFLNGRTSPAASTANALFSSGADIQRHPATPLRCPSLSPHRTLLRRLPWPSFQQTAFIQRMSQRQRLNWIRLQCIRQQCKSLDCKVARQSTRDSRKYKERRLIVTVTVPARRTACPEM